MHKANQTPERMELQKMADAINTISSVPERLNELANVYQERAALYGDNYKRIGLILRELMGGSIKLETEADFGRFAMFTQIVFKQSRYGQQFKNGGHIDSLDDGAVYSQMLQELDDYYARANANKDQN